MSAEGACNLGKKSEKAKAVVYRESEIGDVGMAWNGKHRVEHQYLDAFTPTSIPEHSAAVDQGEAMERIIT